MRIMLKSKLHRVRITDANIDYEGSISIDKNLMDAADILPYEQVHVLDVNNGSRFTTYAIEAERGSGEICVNGAAARLVAKGDIAIILTYTNVEETETLDYHPKLVYFDGNNNITRTGESSVFAGNVD